MLFGKMKLLLLVLFTVMTQIFAAKHRGRLGKCVNFSSKERVLRQASRKSIDHPVCARQESQTEKRIIAHLKKIVPAHKCLIQAELLSTYTVHSRRMRRTVKDDLVSRFFASGINGVTADLSTTCYERGHVHSTNTVQMCRECAYFITLPAKYNPRYLWHKTCEDTTGSNHCLLGYGSCVETVSRVTITNKHNCGLLHVVSITTGCSCQVNAASALISFVQ